MTELEQLREYEALLMEEMDLMAQELVEVRAEIARLSAEESDNEYWEFYADEAGTVSYKLKALNETFDLFRNGSREEYHYSYMYEGFHCRYVATLTDDIPPANTAHYIRANQNNFGKLITHNRREGPILATVYDADNAVIDGLRIPYASSIEGGERNSTIEMREYWNKDSTIQWHRRKADLKTRSLDREYRKAGYLGTLDEFNDKYPFYVPKDEWQG